MRKLDIPEDARIAAHEFLDAHQGASDTEVVNGIIEAVTPAIAAMTLLAYSRMAECAADKVTAVTIARDLDALEILR